MWNPFPLSLLLLSSSLLLAGVAAAEEPAAADPDRRMQRIEDQMLALEDELTALKQDQNVDRARVEQVEQELLGFESLLERVRFGGYGSVRYEANSLGEMEDTFTFRRLVFTTEAQLAPKLRFYSELEYERFRKLELEREVRFVDESAGGPGLLVVQEVEGTNQSEIALEQAWLEYAFDPRLRLRVGGVMIPLGRFNIDHDDNQWNLPRRTLVDRGVPVLPAKAAWTELGAGFTGRFDLGEGGLDYELYLVNGVAIEPEIEEIVVTRTGKRDKLELEAEFSPQTGTFSNDVKEAKAVAGRLAWQPRPGHELGLSFYTGRYTPDWMEDRSVTSFAIDGITRLYGIELEGELVTTHWGGIQKVAESFAQVALRRESANPSAFDPLLEAEIEFDLGGFAKRTTGYWLELRYPFWPSVLPRHGFDDPQLIPTLRWEQVLFDDRIVSLDFDGGVVTGFEREDRRLNRITAGLAYRPTPLVVFTAAYEYTWTDPNGSLAGLTNFLTARENEHTHHGFLLAASFGF